jgi:L-fuconolactonase
VVGWVDLRAPDVGTVLAGLTGRRKLKGIRHIVQGEPDDRFMLGEAFLRGIAALSAWGSGGLGPPEPIAGGLGPSQGPRSATSSLTYDILVYPRQLPAAVELAARFPQQAFVLDHIAKPEMKAGLREPWATQIRKLATSPNVLCKLSGLVTEADWARWKPDDIVPYLDIVTDAFGPTRLMIGSDWPVCALAADYGRTMSLVENYLARLSAAEADAVLGGNATRFYRL